MMDKITILVLPIEILYNIFTFLNCKDIISFVITTTSYENINNTWKSIFNLKYPNFFDIKPNYESNYKPNYKKLSIELENNLKPLDILYNIQKQNNEIVNNMLTSLHSKSKINIKKNLYFANA